MKQYVNRPMFVQAVIYTIDNGPSLPNFRLHREPPLGQGSQGHGVFDSHKDGGSGVLIVQPGDYVVYFSNGNIKTYTPQQFEFMFQPTEPVTISNNSPVNKGMA